MRKPFLTPLEFVVHLLTGTLVFIVIALVAVVLNLLVIRLANLGVSPVIVWGLRFVEYFLFLVDVILFVVFVVRTALRTVRKI